MPIHRPDVYSQSDLSNVHSRATLLLLQDLLTRLRPLVLCRRNPGKRGRLSKSAGAAPEEAEQEAASTLQVLALTAHLHRIHARTRTHACAHATKFHISIHPLQINLQNFLPLGQSCWCRAFSICLVDWQGIAHWLEPGLLDRMPGSAFTWCVRMMQRNDALLATHRLWIRAQATWAHMAARRLHDTCCIAYGYFDVGHTAAPLWLQIICYMVWSDNIAKQHDDACCLLPYSRQMRLLAKVIACACWQAMICTCTYAAVIHHWLKFAQQHYFIKSKVKRRGQCAPVLAFVTHRP